MSDKPKRPYDLGRGVQQLYNRGVPPAGPETEAHVELSRDWDFPNPTGLPSLRVPFSAFASTRQMGATIGATRMRAPNTPKIAGVESAWILKNSLKKKSVEKAFSKLA